MNSIVQIPGTAGATGPREQSLRDEIRHLWGRLQLQLPPFEGSKLRIAICSTHPGEGSTTVAANLSIFLGQQGRRNALIECNLRHPSLADHFTVPRCPGICEYLEGQAQLEEAIRQDTAPGVDLVPAGSPPADVYAMLGSSGVMESLLEAIAARTEFFVLDIPPLSVSPEAGPILRAVDAAVLVVQADRTRRKSVEKSLQTFDELGVPCCGVVLNRVQYDLPPFIDQVL